jgi:phospholipid/cholesterol/gamma-HCH transport system substrate-binding protein
MNDSPNRRTVIVGLFVFIGVTFLLGGIFMVGNMRGVFKDKMEIVSFFDDVNGLKKGNNIWFSGVKIGTVSNLRFYGKSKVEVGMNIEKKSQQYIRKDAEVKISSDGFIGNKILIIYGGTSKSEEVQDGDTLDVEKTFSTEDMINMLQDNNKNFLAITTNFKTISEKLVAGEGTIGKFLNDNSVFANINNATVSLQNASLKAQQLISSLATFSSGLNTKGTLANELTTDTVVFKSIRASVLQLQKIADSASVFIANLKQTAGNPNSPIGVMLQDKESGTQLKETIKNLASSSKKLDEDLEAAQHNFLLRGYFKNKAKTNKSDSLAKQKN